MRPLVDLTTNVSQIFTELYEAYSLLENAPLNVFENSLYLEGLQAVTIKERRSDLLKEYHKTDITLGLYMNPDKR